MPLVLRKPTIVDIARACGVTHATVSRVLNGKLTVRPELHKEITRTAREMGYAPNLAARTLNGDRSQIVGVFASQYTNFAKGISEFLIEGLVEVLQPANYEVFYRALSATRRGKIDLPFWRFDGAVLLQGPDPEIVESLRRRQAPYIGVNEVVAGAAANIISDDKQGVGLALEHLAGLGHRCIAYANAAKYYVPHYSIDERHEAVVAGAQERRIKLATSHAKAFDWNDAAGFLRDAIADRATAILCYDHQEAMLLLSAAYEMHVRIPDDMSLMCFNDVFPLEILPPPMTAVRVDGKKMGEVGAQLLLEVMTGERPFNGRSRRKIVRIAEELVPRGSTAPPGRHA